MKENDIRPHALTQGQVAAFEKDLNWLATQFNNYVYSNCPACQSDKPTYAFEKYKHTHMICTKCETMYINPRPTPEILAEYYEKSEQYKYWNKYIFPQSKEARRKKIFIPRARKIAQLSKKYKAQGTLLEVGAGFGTFCEEIKRLNVFKRVIAIEPSHDLAKTCRGKGIEVIEKPVEQVTITNIDTVVSFEVIEHLFSPRDFLLKCKKILSPNGLLVITCPNGKGFDISVLQNLSDNVGMDHINYFNLHSLSLLVKDCGFEVLEVSTPGKLDVELVQNKVKNGEYTPIPFIRSLLDKGDKFQQFLAGNNLSSHMWLVAHGCDRNDTIVTVEKKV